jgi:hypothetical protein
LQTGCAFSSGDGQKWCSPAGNAGLFEQALERLKQMDKEEFVRGMQAEVRAALERAAEAVNGATEGRVINESEKAVREAMVELQRRSFEKALQMRGDSTESTFFPSEGRGGKGRANKHLIFAFADARIGGILPPHCPRAVPGPLKCYDLGPLDVTRDRNQLLGAHTSVRILPRPPTPPPPGHRAIVREN